MKNELKVEEGGATDKIHSRGGAGGRGWSERLVGEAGLAHSAWRMFALGCQQDLQLRLPSLLKRRLVKGWKWKSDF